MAAATNEARSVTTWILDEFYDRQWQLFAGGKSVSEVLHNTETQRPDDLAWVRSDYVDGRRGKAAETFDAAPGELKIHSLTSSSRR
jgi:hypothetical protein